MNRSNAAPRPAGLGQEGLVRPFEARDVEAVVQLRQEAFRQSRWKTASELGRYFEHVFLRNPWRTEDVGPLVYETATGTIAGFVGAVPRPMAVGGRSLRAATVTQFMVAPDYRGGPGRKLLGALMAGPQDLTFSDVANAAAQRTWESAGGVTAHPYNVFWTLTLRSAGSRALRRGARLVRRGARSVAGRFTLQVEGSPSARTRPSVSHSTDVARMAAWWPELIDADLLRAEYDEVSLSWLHEQVRWKWGAEHVRIGRVGEGRAGGWFVYVLQPDGVAFMVQLAASRSSFRTVLDHAASHARRAGAAALRGRLQPRFLPELTEAGCSFDSAGPLLLVHARDEQLLAKVLAGGAILTGLDGEWWMDF